MKTSRGSATVTAAVPAPACNVESGEVRILRALPPLRADSLAIVEGGVLTAHGRVGFDRPSDDPSAPRTLRWSVSVERLDIEEAASARRGEDTEP